MKRRGSSSSSKTKRPNSKRCKVDVTPKKEETVIEFLPEYFLPFELGAIIYEYADRDSKRIMSQLSKEYRKFDATYHRKNMSAVSKAWSEQISPFSKMPLAQLTKVKDAVSQAYCGIYPLASNGKSLPKSIRNKAFEAAALGGHLVILKRMIEQEKSLKDQVRMINRALHVFAYTFDHVSLRKILGLALNLGEEATGERLVPKNIELGMTINNCWYSPEQFEAHWKRFVWTNKQMPPPLTNSDVFTVEKDTNISRIYQAQCLMLWTLRNFCGPRTFETITKRIYLFFTRKMEKDDWEKSSGDDLMDAVDISDIVSVPIPSKQIEWHIPMADIRFRK